MLRSAGLLVVAGILLVGGYLAYCLATLPFNGGLAVDPTPGAMVLTAADGRMLATRGVFKGEKLSFADIPQDVVHALVATEDRRFFEHPGLDWRGALRALWRDVRSGEAREGGSTITQQLVRMTYLSRERTLKRKVQEAMLALWLEHQLSKQEILARYLNMAYFGAGVFGIDAAARRYFGKAAGDLDLAESAMLVGLLRAPTAFDPHRNLEAARRRADLVLGEMIGTGAITREQADAARRQPGTLKVPAEAPLGTGFFLEAAAQEANRVLGATGTDLRLATTLDPDLQAFAETVVGRFLAAEGPAKAASQAALVAMAPDGAVLAMVGGRDYAESQFNRVTQAERQPGSLFKLFVYLTALEKGYSPGSVVVDRPVTIGDWSPENFEGRSFGPVSLHTAFAHSINGVAAQLGQAVGIKSVIATARALGIVSNMPDVPSLALGSAEVNLLEMVRAYAAVAFNDGRLVQPYTIREIRRAERVVYRQTPPDSAPVVPPQTRAAMLELLAAVVREGTGRAALLPGQAAGKTGTTQDNRDAWFIGFTPEIIVGVWVGNDDHSPMKGVTGGDLPARMWHDFVAGMPRGALPHLVALARPAPAEQPVAAAASVAPPTDGMPILTRTEDLKPGALTGVPIVLDTATLAIDGRAIRLLGVDGLNGNAARDLSRYIRQRQVICAPSSSGSELYRCSIDGRDLSTVVLFNGGGRANGDAPADLKTAEGAARAAGTGIWAQR
ncbi:MAG: PBP1A family penicillin-binding protein [Methylobacteriaceae bacterium]|nr:PBP1A family penicillin-binding protein [Methylobacteriaceae bacterium]